MAEFCTCGAELPPDALFCHKCGKPQREIIAPEVEQNPYIAPPSPTAPPPETAPQQKPLPLNFHNPIAVRVALLAAVSATVLSLLAPVLPMLMLDWLVAGFFAVFSYYRKTGFRLDVGAGVKIGWITGLIAYGFWAVVFTIQQLPDVLSGQLGRSILDQLKNAPSQDPAMVQAMTKIIQNNPGMLILFALGAWFVFVTCLAMAGGALGAKLTGGTK